MEILRVKNWEHFQQYKDREPKWIKVYRTLLHDYKYDQLNDAEFGQLVKIWLLASQIDNEIPHDAEWIQHKTGMNKKPDLKKLIRLGFLQINGSVQKCTDNSKDVYLETETETEKRKRHNMSELGCVWCIHETYCKIMGKNSNQYKLTPEKKKKIKARLVDSSPKDIYKSIEACKASEHHMGYNDRNQLYNDLLKNIIPSREKVEWWLERTPKVEIPIGGFEL